ncbi:MAG: dihydroorotase, partial [Oceanospirillaceae bacterium]
SHSILLKREPWQLPMAVAFDNSQLIPLAAGTTLNWKLSL